MKKRLRMVLWTVIGLGLLILGVALVWPGAGFPNAGGEPTFEGKPSSRWRADLRAELAAGSKESQPVSVSLMRGGA
jgi:hypothetical protein